MMFTKTNPHPTGKKIGDCVVRAIAIAETKKWIDVYDELYHIARGLHEMPNSKAVYEKLLLDNGYMKFGMPRKPNGKRYTALELALTPELNNRSVIMSVAKHLTVSVNGCIHDTWDCGGKSVYNYYVK